MPRIEDVNDYSFYDKLENMLGYNGYVTGKAQFLKVRGKNEYHTNHNVYAHDFIKYFKMEEKYAKANVSSPFEYLVNCLGYAAYSVLDGKSYITFPPNPTAEQLTLLKTLVIENKTVLEENELENGKKPFL